MESGCGIGVDVGMGVAVAVAVGDGVIVGEGVNEGIAVAVGVGMLPLIEHAESTKITTIKKRPQKRTRLSIFIYIPYYR